MSEALREAVSVLRQCLAAMDAARDAIQPVTQAQMKLHRLNPQTDRLLDDAADRAMEFGKRTEAALAAQSEPAASGGKL